MNFQTLKSLYPYFFKYRKEIVIGVASLLVTDLVHLVIPWLLKEFVDLLPSKPSGGTLVRYAVLLFLTACVIAVSRFGWRRFLLGPSRKVEFEILNRLMAHLSRQDRSWFVKQKVGDLMSRATNDLRSVREFFGLGLLIFLDSTVVITCSVGLMLYIHPGLTMVCLLPFPLISFLFFKFSRKISERQREAQAHLSEITSRVQENLAGIRVLHAFVQEEAEKKKFDVLNREYIRKNVDLAGIYALFTSSLVITLGFSALLSLWLGGKAVIDGELSLGSFVAFNGYLLMLSWPMMGVGYMFNLTQKGLTAMSRINEILAVQPEIVDAPAPAELTELKGKIEFRSLQFQYEGATESALHEINLTIEPGRRVAIVGMIGAGKSSLVQLVPRIFDPLPGSLLIDDRPVQEIPLQVLRQQIGYVSQEPFLFSATIRENIAFGKPDASLEEIREVVRKCGLMKDMEQFPDGLETLVGEKGVSLSGGQKQRVALARAMIRRPRILILDDAFSSLDVETEEFILTQLWKDLGAVTALIVTHRMSVVRQVDEVVVLDQGKIVQRGTHVELLSQDGFYRQTFHRQSLAREMEIYLQ